jgi:hypothetical protein
LNPASVELLIRDSIEIGLQLINERAESSAFYNDILYMCVAEIRAVILIGTSQESEAW